MGAPGALARAFIAVLCAWGAPAFAGDALIRPAFLASDRLRDRVYFFAGLDVARDSAFGWAGVAGAPFGRLDEDGVRLRLMGGAGRYRYRTASVAGGINEGTVSAAELLLGFRRAKGGVSATAYVGPHMENQRLAAPDPANAAAGTAVGVKAALEIYARLDPLWVMNASASASTVHGAYHARAALARETAYGLSTGFEAALLGDVRYVEPRAGLFASVACSRSVFTLAAGLLDNSDKGGGAYATISLYVPY
jgi:hypothetical protein